jgi:hypothetical protein
MVGGTPRGIDIVALWSIALPYRPKVVGKGRETRLLKIFGNFSN